ncbi:MAG TPA: dATP pyrophosphohydrolase [Caulobacteraceae bacterium]|nr:dATP pyrophosphohydrolase [Caulobacteraceae bacterium]
MTSSLDIVPVTDDRELERFIRAPMRLMADDPKYVAPLLFERREALSPKHNPFFEHADCQFWLARRGGVDVGRISAQIDQLAPADGAAPTGHFGMICAEDDPETFAALFDVAERWLEARGKTRAMGPFNLSINEEVGLLVEGFDTPPMFMMGHDPPYAAARIQQLGYAKAKDVYAYVSGVTDVSAAVRARLDRPPPRGIVLRPVRMNHFGEDVRALVEILNDAWSENWGWTPVTEAETRHLAESLRLILNPRLVWFAEIDGEIAGFGVLLPDLNTAIADLGGRLLPLGWLKLLWRLKVTGVRRGRIPLMGVRRKFGRDRRGALAPFLIIDAIRREALKAGFREAEYSWILEDNAPMRHILESCGARIYKTYRIYEKSLSGRAGA